jgi:predicted ATPase
MAKKQLRIPVSRSGQEPARIEYLRIENYRALELIEFKDITPIIVLLGPNASKSFQVLRAALLEIAATA